MKHLSSISIVGLLGLTLSACLVNHDNATTWQRTTDNLRIYQPGDYLNYELSGYDVSGASASPITGSMQIKYATHAPLQKPAPLNGESVNAMQESTVLSISLGGSPIINHTVARYIVQDNLGNVTLHAFDNPNQNTNTYFWVTGDSPNTSTSEPTPVVITPSPYVVQNSSYRFNISDCNTTQTCTPEFEYMMETQKILRTEDKVANVGKFSAFRVEFDNSTVTKTGSPSDPFINVDFREFCNSLSSTSTVTTSFSGNMWVFPEVGVIKYEMSCTSGSRTIQLNASLSGTNIPLPN